jgi:hypothetical protein
MNTKIKTAEYLEQCRSALAEEQAESLTQTNNWSHVDKNQVHADWDSLYRQLVPLIDHQPTDSVEVQSFIERHYSIVSRFYKPSKMAYIGMSLLYAENDDMRTFHNSYHPKMVAFLAEAIPIYASNHL